MLAFVLPVARAFVIPPSTQRRPLAPAVAAFEPGPVDASVVAGQLTVILASAAAASYWWTVTVPQKRLEVSRSKKKGEIKTLLDDLAQAENAADGSVLQGDKRLERWLLSDWCP